MLSIWSTLLETLLQSPGNFSGREPPGRGWAWTCQALSRTMSWHTFRRRWWWEGLGRHSWRWEGSFLVKLFLGEGGGKPTDPRRCLLWSRWWGWCRSPAGSSELLLVQSNRLAWKEHVRWFRFFCLINLSFKLCQLGLTASNMEHVIECALDIVKHNECSMLNLVPGL